jgi:hypothetical protein
MFLAAGQMRWQTWSIGPRSRCLGCRRWKRGFDPCDVGMEVVEAELQLIVIEPFGAPAKLAALQLLNDEPEAFDLRLRRCEVDAFGRERPDHPPQRVYIIWQSGKIDVHELEVYTDSRISSSTIGVLSQSVAALSRHRGSPLPLRCAPIDAVNQHRQLCRGQHQRPARFRRSTATGTRRARAAW